jgi:hypothetical protein
MTRADTSIVRSVQHYRFASVSPSVRHSSVSLQKFTLTGDGHCTCETRLLQRNITNFLLHFVTQPYTIYTVGTSIETFGSTISDLTAVQPT